MEEDEGPFWGFSDQDIMSPQKPTGDESLFDNLCGPCASR